MSTDSLEIRNIALDSGVLVVDRPTALATSTATAWETWDHAINVCRNMGRTYMASAYLEPTCPLRKPGDLVGAWQVFIDKEVNELWTVTPIPMKFHAWKQIIDGQVAYSGSHIGLPNAYYRNGVMYIRRLQKHEKERDRQIYPNQAGEYSHDIYLHILEQTYISIDTQEDLDECRRIMANPNP